MFSARRIQNDFNKAASEYDAHCALQNHVSKRLTAKLGILKPEMLVLDAGCGTGALSRTVSFKNIIALDHAFLMCVRAERTGATPVNADMNQLPFAEGSFDIVFSSLALQWSMNWKATLHEWLRVLKPRGRVIFSSFAKGTLHELTESFRAADSNVHVSFFADAGDIANAFPAELEQETVIEHYPDVATLARHLKTLGARNKMVNGRKGLMTGSQLGRVEDHYKKYFSDSCGLKASWNVFYTEIIKA